MKKDLSPTDAVTVDRRGLLRLGGLGLATAAVAAACSDGGGGGEIGRVGVGDPQPELEDGIVDNAALLRTAASIELSIVGAYEDMIERGVLAEPSPTHPDLGDQTELVTLFAEHHRTAAARFNELAVEVGAEPFECVNPRLTDVTLDAIFTRVFEGAPATDTSAAIGPSDDATRDMVNLVYCLEALSAATAQAMVAQATEAPLRAAGMELGVRSARQSALMSLHINPGGYVPASAAATPEPAATTTAPPTTAQDIAAPEEDEAPAEEAPPQTPIPLTIANPTTYGSLAPVTWVGGLGDENGVRLRVNFEPPSLNSMVYEFTTCE